MKISTLVCGSRGFIRKRTSPENATIVMERVEN